jgi:hypothetical protein
MEKSNFVIQLMNIPLDAALFDAHLRLYCSRKEENQKQAREYHQYLQEELQ